MEFENNSFETRYNLERVIATLGRRKANKSILRLSEVTWSGRENLDLRIWYEGDATGPGIPGKGIVMSHREAILLLYGLLDYFRNIMADVERNVPRPSAPDAEEPKAEEIPAQQTAYSSF